MLKVSHSVCLSWRGHLSTSELFLLICPAEPNSRRARKQRLGCRAQNLRFKDHIFDLWVNIRFASALPFVQPSPDIRAYWHFLGRGDQKRARSINLICGVCGYQRFKELLVLVMHESWQCRFIKWAWAEWLCTHSSDSRCSRWKVLGWISLMLFMLRSLEREKRGKSKSQSMRAFLMFSENAQRRKIINVSNAFFIWKSILASREQHTERGYRVR